MYSKEVICPVCFNDGAEIGYDSEAYLMCHSCTAKPIDVSELIEKEFGINRLCQVCKNMDENGCGKPTCTPQTGYPEWESRVEVGCIENVFECEAWRQAYARLYHGLDKR